MRRSNRMPRLAALAAIPILVGIGTALAAQSRGGVEKDEPAIDEAYVPGEFGVDVAIITGPISPEFRKRREAAGCDRAVWPNIPAACYPDRQRR